MKRILLLTFTAVTLGAIVIPVAGQPLRVERSTVEALQPRDIAARKREARHLRAKQKKLLKRQRAKAKQHLKRARSAAQ